MGMKRSISAVMVYLLIVLGLSVPFWLGGTVIDRLFPRSIPINLPFAAFMFVCPVLAASILVYREGGWPSVKGLLVRAFDVSRVKDWRWYLAAAGLMVLFVGLAYGMRKASDSALPPLHAPDWVLPLSFILFMIGAMGEELGWMGFAIDPLQERFGALKAGLMLGVIWAAWHIIPFSQAHNPPAWIVGQCLFTVATRVLIVWLYNNTGKSVFIAVLYHAMLNVASVTLQNYGLIYDPVLTGILVILAAAAVAFFWGPRTLAHFRYARHPTEYAG
jgi:uncharacterized protein